jgi:hypothetical protein
MTYDDFRELVAKNPQQPITLERLAEIVATTYREGPVNSWTGTSGNHLTMIRELLRERIRLVEQIERSKDELGTAAKGE